MLPDSKATNAPFRPSLVIFWTTKSKASFATDILCSRDILNCVSLPCVFTTHDEIKHRRRQVELTGHVVGTLSPSAIARIGSTSVRRPQVNLDLIFGMGWEGRAKCEAMVNEAKGLNQGRLCLYVIYLHSSNCEMNLRH
jgi:hypothetical protein